MGGSLTGRVSTALPHKDRRAAEDELRGERGQGNSSVAAQHRLILGSGAPWTVPPLAHGWLTNETIACPELQGIQTCDSSASPTPPCTPVRPLRMRQTDDVTFSAKRNYLLVYK